jgi:hypothetical protein
MTSMSFEEILSRPTSEIKPPPPIPTGHYHCMVDGVPEHGLSRERQTNYFRFKYKIIAAGNDVDAAEALEQQVVGKIITQDFYLTENMVTQNIFKEFLEDVLGIENPDGKMGLKELITHVPNCQLIVELRHDISRDGKRTFSKVNSTAHV